MSVEPNKFLEKLGHNGGLCDICGQRADYVTADSKELPPEEFDGKFYETWQLVPNTTKVRCYEHRENYREYRLDGTIVVNRPEPVGEEYAL